MWHNIKLKSQQMTLVLAFSLHIYICPYLQPLFLDDWAIYVTEVVIFTALMGALY